MLALIAVFRSDAVKRGAGCIVHHEACGGSESANDRYAAPPSHPAGYPDGPLG